MRGKNKKAERDRKVIPFPGLANRLIELGLDALREKEFKEAAKHFSQARELDPDHPELNIGLVVSWVELGNYREAKALCRELLLKGIGDYFQVVNIYLMILLNLNEHQEMIHTIKALLEEKQVPPDKEEHFYKMLEFCERSLEETEIQDVITEQDEAVLTEEIDFLAQKPEQEQLLLISQLAHANIRPYLREVQGFLRNPDAHPFLKTLLINILKEQSVHEETEIQKFSRSMKVNPEHLPDVMHTDFLIHTLDELESRLSHENPTLMEFAQSLIERHNFLLYPFEPSEQGFHDWAAAYHFLIAEYQGESAPLAHLAEKYSGDPDNINTIIKRIREFEEISYPII
ncbi:tetratricopeptide (TPR) repeat protein [Peribacillus deserti]|uniref:Tetratricopeptide (TPR) repeat protein n=1 Tax=Peribacillus deserti TaxID=673318 RepID=A0ABS2QFP7_9BACI|nr:tetratricopeptide repeat protein [Peribacillus deserti]MBM7691970.1 tetratricopeptide (TPR) repeat protein [Peribacillus deserti]